MAKRSALSFDRDQLTEDLRASAGQGVGALFSPSPGSQAQSKQPEPLATRVSKKQTGEVAKPSQQEDSQQSEVGTTIPLHNHTKGPRDHDAMIPRPRDLVSSATVRQVRNAVKRLGKEAATHRFTQQEKEKIADIVYTYYRQGYKTSENEIARIGINWLIDEYVANGSRSVLHRVLKALRA